MQTSPTLRIALAQIAPAFLDREATPSKVVERVEEAAAGGAGLVVFGEALVPGYPVWIERTDGARFESAEHRELHARYLRESVRIEGGDLDAVCDAARRGGVAVCLGVMERAADRGGHNLYCASLYAEVVGDLTRYAIDDGVVSANAVCRDSIDRLWADVAFVDAIGFER